MSSLTVCVLVRTWTGTGPTFHTSGKHTTHFQHDGGDFSCKTSFKKERSCEIRQTMRW